MNKKGFTLIELLVVISIIGLISSIVLVSTKGLKEKARLAKSQQLSSSIRHALGATTAGMWRFEKGSGAVAYDESGYGNNGIIHDNEGDQWTSGLTPGSNALEFDGVDDYIEIPSSNTLFIKKNLVWELWFNADAVSGVRTLIQQGGNWNFLWLFNGKIRFVLNDVGSTSISMPALFESNINITSGKWYHLVAVYDGVKMYLYINGTLDNETATTGADVGGAGICPGGIPCITTSISAITAPPFDGIIDEVRIYEGGL